MPLSYEQYQEEVISDILNVLGQAACQPILFVGSGFFQAILKRPELGGASKGAGFNVPQHQS
jgi:hypothetical protein